MTQIQVYGRFNHAHRTTITDTMIFLPILEQRVDRSQAQSEGKLLPPLPRYTATSRYTNQSLVDGILSVRGSVGSNYVSDVTHFTAARASSEIVSPVLPTSTSKTRESYRSVGSNTEEV